MDEMWHIAVLILREPIWELSLMELIRLLTLLRKLLIMDMLV